MRGPARLTDLRTSRPIAMHVPPATISTLRFPSAVTHVSSSRAVDGRAGAATSLTDARGVGESRRLVQARALLGAAVPGRVDFSASTPMPSAALAMYAHPADRNAAATGVHAGKLIDTRA